MLIALGFCCCAKAPLPKQLERKQFVSSQYFQVTGHNWGEVRAGIPGRSLEARTDTADEEKCCLLACSTVVYPSRLLCPGMALPSVIRSHSLQFIIKKIFQTPIGWGHFGFPLSNSCQGDRTLVNTHIACVRMFAWVYLHLSTTRMPGIYGGQKRALDPLELEFQSMVSYSGAEPSPGEEQPVPLAAELSLQPVHLSLDDSLLTIRVVRIASVAFLHSSFPIYPVWNVNVKVLSLLPRQFRVSCKRLLHLDMILIY